MPTEHFGGGSLFADEGDRAAFADYLGRGRYLQFQADEALGSAWKHVMRDLANGLSADLMRRYNDIRAEHHQRDLILPEIPQADYDAVVNRIKAAYAKIEADPEKKREFDARVATIMATVVAR